MRLPADMSQPAKAASTSLFVISFSPWPRRVASRAGLEQPPRATPTHFHATRSRGHCHWIGSHAGRRLFAYKELRPLPRGVLSQAVSHWGCACQRKIRRDTFAAEKCLPHIFSVCRAYPDLIEPPFPPVTLQLIRHLRARCRPAYQSKTLRHKAWSSASMESRASNLVEKSTTCW